MLDRVVAAKNKRQLGPKITMGADTQFREEGLIQQLRDREVRRMFPSTRKAGAILARTA
jgi:hypothetical protein